MLTERFFFAYVDLKFETQEKGNNPFQLNFCILILNRSPYFLFWCCSIAIWGVEWIKIIYRRRRRRKSTKAIDWIYYFHGYCFSFSTLFFFSLFVLVLFIFVLKKECNSYFFRFGWILFCFVLFYFCSVLLYVVLAIKILSNFA